MITTRVELYRGGEVVAKLPNVRDLQYNYKLNTPGTAVFNYNGNNVDQTIIDNLIKGSEIRIFRKGDNDTSEKLVWTGEITDPKRTINPDREITYNIQAHQWSDIYFTNRFITTSFVSTEESLIAKGIIDEMQSNTQGGTFTIAQVNWGITFGTLETTSNIRDRTYVDDQVLKILNQLANTQDIGGNPQRIRGWRLSPDFLDQSQNVFSWYANIGTVRSNIVYNNPVIKDLTITSTIKGMANQVIGLGANSLRSTQTSSDIANLDFYKLRQGLASLTNIETQNSLDNSTANELAQRGLPADVFTFSPTENDPLTGTYREGDIVTIQFTDSNGVMNLSKEIRVYEIAISWDGSGVERNNLVVAEYSNANEQKPASLSVTPDRKLIGGMTTQESRLDELEKRIN